MIALEITSPRQLMGKLLAGEAFDLFLLEEAVIQTAAGYTIDGHINKEFYPESERNEECIPYRFLAWSEARPICFDLIKGKNTPLYFKFVLQLKPEEAKKLLADRGEIADETRQKLKALVLNIRFDKNRLLLTSGTSYETFVADRDPEKLWDAWVCRFLDENGIGYRL